MPITKSAKKALRASIRRKRFNDRRKKTLKDTERRTLKLVSAGKRSDAEKSLPILFKAVDKATKHGTIKKNTAARKKSRFSKLVK
jgi:small subunit ribosomal protein S20